MFAAVLALAATTSFTAYAQEDPAAPSTAVTEPSTPAESSAPAEPTTPTAPAESTAPTESSVPNEPAAPPVAEQPAAPPVAEQPAEKPAQQQAERSNVQATAEIAAGPFLVGQTVPIKLIVTNSGAAEATGVSAWMEHISGSYLSINREDWDGLQAPWGEPSTLKIAAGTSRTFNLKGKSFGYQGNPKFKIRVNATNDVDPHDGSPIVEVPMKEPVKTGKISGVLWGDANGNGVQDAGEGLVGAEAYLYGGGDPNATPRTRTDANGRFTFTDVELRAWGLNFTDLPGGWVLPYISEPVPVDGSDSTSELRYQAVRPLVDQLTASMRFVSGDYVDGGKVAIEFTLTNKGGADITEVVAGCGRSGEGPHVQLWDGLGDLDWSKGATIPAGQSRVFPVTGTISSIASSYGYSFVSCDFGPKEGIIDGYPHVFDYVKVGNKRTNTNGSIYVDLNGNGWMDGQEHLTGVSFSLADPKTGEIVATATGTGEYGEAYFNDIPTGLYTIVVNGPYKLKHPEWMITAADCSKWCQTGWAIPVVPVEGPGGPQPQPEQPQQPEQPKIVPLATYTSTAGPLAETGASVSGLGLVGALTLLVGGASVFLARRRTA